MSRHHGHLWTLLDGTPAHARPGELTRNGDGELACHLCGRWFAHLGGHLRSHGWTVAQYRDAVGLTRHIALCSKDLSQRIADRQRAQWTNDAAFRERLEAGQQMARSGELAERASVVGRVRETTRQISEYVVAARANHLTEGRETVKKRREAHLLDVVLAAGAIDLHDLLRASYANGGTLDSLASLTGLGRQRLRAELDAAGIAVRRPGDNVARNRSLRAQRIDAAAAARVGTDDIHQWLVNQISVGRSPKTLADETGRSVVWVRSRLRGTTTSAPRDKADQRRATRSTCSEAGNATHPSECDQRHQPARVS